jgi:hypothetical protein
MRLPTLHIPDLERMAIEDALVEHRGNRTHSARELGISVDTLRRRMRQYGLKAPMPAWLENFPKAATCGSGKTSGAV